MNAKREVNAKLNAREVNARLDAREVNARVNEREVNAVGAVGASGLF